MSLHSIIEHRANYYFLKLEEDYVEICQGKHKHCKAAILSILENWMNSKRATASRESDLYVYLSYPQFVKQMFGLYGRNTVIASLEELEQEGLILKRPFRDVFNQVTFEYRLNCSVVQQELSKLSDKPATWGSVNLNGGSLEMDGGAFENKRGGSVKVNDPPFKSKRNIESNIDSNIEPTQNTEREEVADATARSQSSSQNDLSEETEKREAVKPSQKEVGNGDTHLYIGGNSRSTDGHAPTTLQNPSGDTLRTTPPQSTKDTNKVTEPPAPRKPPTNSVPRRPKQQGIVLTDEIPGPDIPEKAVAIMDRWDSVHKKPAPRTLKTIQAAQLLMVYDPSEDELRECEKWLYTTDRPGKPWYRSHGVHLPDIAEKIGSWQSLQNAPPAKPEKEPSNEHKAAKQPANAFIERCLDKDYNKRKLEEMRAENERRRQAQAAGGVQS